MTSLKYILLAIVGLCACKTKVEPVKPEIDFSSPNYFTPSEITKYKVGVSCGENPYWEGKSVKLQGFLFSGNINPRDKTFFLYDNIKIFDPLNLAVIIHFQPKDSAVMMKKLLDANNKDKNCFIKATCFTFSGIIINCETIIDFTITKPEDLEFK
jgi:hypothetical protein